MAGTLSLQIKKIAKFSKNCFVVYQVMLTKYGSIFQHRKNTVKNCIYTFKKDCKDKPRISQYNIGTPHPPKLKKKTRTSRRRFFHFYEIFNSTDIFEEKKN